MATNTADIRAGGTLTGGIAWAVLGSTLPTAPLPAALAGAFKDLGGIDDSGIVMTPTTSTTDVRLRNGALGRRLISSSEYTFQFTAVETNPNTFSVFFPGSTTVTATGVATQTIKPPATNILVWVLDETDGTINTRTVIPRGEVVDFGAVTSSLGTVKAYQMTVAAYLDASGNSYYRYTDDPAFP